MRLAVFTHVIHQELEERYYAYIPYVREMNIWVRQVEEVEVVAPSWLAIRARDGKPPNPRRRSGFGASYIHSHLIFTKIPSFHLMNFNATVEAIFIIPLIFFRMLGAMRRADHIHLRCPGNVGLIACFAQIFFPQTPKTAKYAGNWDSNSKQPRSYKLQKWILSNTYLTRNMTVLVYGKWAKQTKNILPFFTASFSEKEREIKNKEFTTPYKFLFVGNLVIGKRPDIAIKVVETLNKRNIQAELHFYGDGELMASLQDQSNNKTYIHLHGNESLEVLKQAYKDSHFLILPSKSEGWPKAVAEAMFFGCIPIATTVSCIPWMLGEGSRGVLISGSIREGRGKRAVDSVGVESWERNLSKPIGAGEASQEVLDGIVEKIIELIQIPEEMKRMSLEAQEWSQEYTLERFEEEIKKVLNV
ncbi:glycosyltransferase involved in cell wall biosynthesis [Gillisia sp. Hel_I_86]|uniref:glycosyltransferase family 4 protein n=1 Tax=Gillisia sp. Hel_I_86 TaxID=1249981 RepID=UPI0011991D5F|nr:glycosyltransferase family 4 protein [Gillisia sp. Hel_I_86]TVZ25560.1 glycosyltransferase involved in cell wall biosynthesis [Gillisia sp. Hel_I_86]